jgi:hypothetical protein
MLDTRVPNWIRTSDEGVCPNGFADRCVNHFATDTYVTTMPTAGAAPATPASSGQRSTT